MNRAVITGLGPITPIGIGKNAFWAGLQSGRSAVQRVSLFDASQFRSQIAAEVRDFDGSDYLDAKQLRRLDRYSQFAVATAKLALSDAGLKPGVGGDRMGVCIGSALGGIAYAEKQCAVYWNDGLRAMDIMASIKIFGGSASCNIAIEIGATGPASANSNSCAAGTMALGEALGWIRMGLVDVAVAGGAEAPLSMLCFGTFDQIRAMSCRNDEPERACRPFDAQRDGFVMGEGAAVLVVEELHHALNRGAHIYAEIVGYGTSNDSYHLTAPLPDGSQAARAMAMALSDAKLQPADIDYISAHGSSTPLNDKTETLAIKRVFGEQAHRVAISSTKGYHAHALGASGAFEAVASVLAMEHGCIPPTLNLDNPDHECDLDYTPNTFRSQRVDTVISNSFGFGGINACLARLYEIYPLWQGKPS